jgi:hypothetical protein
MHPDPRDDGRPAGAKQAARESTRAALLAAATVMLFETPAADVLRTLKPVEVARRADPPRTTGAFYNIWPAQEDFRRDLLQHLLSLERFGADQETLRALAGLLEQPEFDLDETVRLASTINFEGNKADPAFLLQMALWTRHRSDPEVDERLRRLYADLVGSAVPTYQAILERTGLRVKEPFTVELVATALIALSEGLTLRWSVEPEAVPDELGTPPGVTAAPDRPWGLLAALVHTLVTALTEPDPDAPRPGTLEPGAPCPES